MWISICDAQIDNYIRIYSGSCSSLTCVDYDDDGCATSITGGASVTFPAVANQSYYALIGNRGPNGYSSFTINTSGVPLDVRMSNLDGKVNSHGSIELFWSTFRENKNRGFDIERSSDGMNFYKIAFAPTKAKSGVSEVPLNYRFTDNEKNEGSIYYRIWQIDYDGSRIVSNTIKLQMKQKEFNISVAPNPTQNVIHIRASGVFESPARAQVYDFTGKLLLTVALTQSETIVNLESMVSGSYLIKYSDASHTRIFKINKQ